MPKDLKTLDREINDIVLSGDVTGPLDKYYDENIVMQEGNATEVTRGRNANKERLKSFVASLKSFNGATLHSSSIGDNVTMSEWTFDMTAGDGTPIIWNEVIRRKWQNGLVVEERFYTAS